jgi:hypothetical protein
MDRLDNGDVPIDEVELRAAPAMPRGTDAAPAIEQRIAILEAAERFEGWRGRGLFRSKAALIRRLPQLEIHLSGVLQSVRLRCLPASRQHCCDGDPRAEDGEAKVGAEHVVCGSSGSRS